MKQRQNFRRRIFSQMKTQIKNVFAFRMLFLLCYNFRSSLQYFKYFVIIVTEQLLLHNIFNQLGINIDQRLTMIRRFSRLLAFRAIAKKVHFAQSTKQPTYRFATSNLWKPISYRFASDALPKHQILNMPALSPTMSEGKIVKWNKNVGDAVSEGDVLCEVETDKATVGFEVTEKGFIAQKRDTSQPVPIGTPLVVVVKNKDDVKGFSGYKFEGGAKKAQKKEEGKQATEKPKKQNSETAQKPKKQKQETGEKKSQTKSQGKQVEQKSQGQAEDSGANASLPAHSKIQMPALSPTMSEGKIVKWNVKEGQAYNEGDSLCDIETDKATVAFQATQKGVLAKILAQENSQMKVGDVLGLSVKKKQDADKFASYKAGGKPKKAAPKKQKAEANEQQATEDKPKQKKQSKSKDEAESTEDKPKSKNQQKSKSGEETQQQGSERKFVSPAAKTLAKQKGVNIKDIEKGSGPQGRILKQDVDGFKPKQKQQAKVDKATDSKKPAPADQAVKKPQKIVIPDNPVQQFPLTNMRKTIAARLTESKSTIPHYYISANIEMDKANALRNELNQGEKENGVKISVNDIIIKAMALALRDFPGVNSQWHGNVVKRFKYADVSVAVATQGGLITPIVYRADTLGLLDIAKRTKDVAKRAREGKLDPREYVGGTTTISNVGMFGIDSVTSVINPPQSTIVGVGKTEKKVLFDQTSINPQKPFRIAEVMQVIVSADHRVVDGAVAAQWLTRIKKYLEHPSQMLL